MNHFWRAWPADKITGIFDEKKDDVSTGNVTVQTCGGVGIAYGETVKQAKAEINAILDEIRTESFEWRLLQHQVDKLKETREKYESDVAILRQSVADGFDEASALTKIAFFMARVLSGERAYLLSDEKERIRKILGEAGVKV